MNFERFVASKILGYKRYKNSISSPIIKISILSIIVGIVVMNISMSIGFGIQKNINEKFSNNVGDLIITNYGNNLFETGEPIDLNTLNLSNFQIPNIKGLSKVSYNPVIFPKDNSFEFLVFKGSEDMISNDPPKLDNNNVSVSKYFAKRNNVKVGDDLTLLFFTKKNKSIPKIRKFNIKFIYDTGIKEFDSKIVFGNFNQSMQINNWSNNHAGGIEVRLSSDSNLELIYESVPSNYKITFNRDRFGEIYNWISLFDSNVYLIVFLMIIVGGINMITALLITILEKRKFIGVLKVLGASNLSVRKIFLINGAYLIIRGLVIGNLISFILLFLQHQFNIIELDPTVYYVNSVPVDLNFINIILLNTSVIVTSFLMLIIPSLVVSKLNPTTIMKSS
ncbi:FtsX-like permease family protein [Flavobacteriales bacterium]|nr:FtsX-like permease family protein [Flavobacteriales bacterium]